MESLKIYACYNTDLEVRKDSSSGGIFSCFADYVIEREGIVYGVTMSEDCYSAEYIGITNKSELYKLRGSKYLQAKMGNTFGCIKKELLNGRLVLFSGTGCQINGLKSYLGKSYDNLVCIDVICHGAPSPALWKKYVKHQEQKHNAKLIDVNFRCKDKNWEDFGIKQVLKEYQKNKIKKAYISKDVDSYMQMFLRDYCLRPSCYECKAKKEKKSDITMADFWGIDNVIQNLNDGKGVSLVLIRTEIGKKIFREIRENIKYKEVSYDEAVKKNKAEYTSAKKPIEREKFFDNMRVMSFEKLEKEYGLPVHIPVDIRLKMTLVKFVRRVIKGFRN